MRLLRASAGGEDCSHVIHIRRVLARRPTFIAAKLSSAIGKSAKEPLIKLPDPSLRG